jgi:hypothetical protein
VRAPVAADPSARPTRPLEAPALQPVRSKAERALTAQRLREVTGDITVSRRIKDCLMDMAVAATKTVAGALVNEQEVSAQNTLVQGFTACVKATRQGAPPELGPDRLVSEQLIAAVQMSAQRLASLESSVVVMPIPWPCTPNELDAVLARQPW